MKRSEQTDPCTLQSAETLKIHQARSPAVEGLGGLCWASPLHAGMLRLCAHPHAHGSHPAQNTAHLNLNSHPVSEKPALARRRQMPGGMWIQRGGPSPSASICPFTQSQTYLFLALLPGLLDPYCRGRLAAYQAPKHFGTSSPNLWWRRGAVLLLHRATGASQVLRGSLQLATPCPACAGGNRFPCLVTGASCLTLSLTEAPQSAVSAGHQLTLTFSYRWHFSLASCTLCLLSTTAQEDLRLTPLPSPLDTTLEVQQRPLGTNVSPVHVAWSQSQMSFSCWWNNLIALQITPLPFP